MWLAENFLNVWENSGTTPAKEGVMVGTYQLAPVDSGLPANFAFPLDNVPRVYSPVGPKSKVSITVRVPLDAINAAHTGRYQLYFWGAYVYRDVFDWDPPRVTEFCYYIPELLTFQYGRQVEINGKLSEPNIQLHWQNAICREHNCYDEQCKDYEQIKSLLPGP